MIYSLQLATRSFLRLTILIAVSAGVASGQVTTTSGSVSLNGAGTLSYTVAHRGLTPCNPNSRTLVPSFQTWAFSGFAYTDVSGATHPLSGGTSFVTVAGSGAGCPQAGGSPVVLNGDGFFINVNPGPGSLTSSLNVQMMPKYYILSILYAPPGNNSTSGFSASTSAAATTSISNSFTKSTSIGVNISVPGGTGVGASYQVSKGHGKHAGVRG